MKRCYFSHILRQQTAAATLNPEAMLFFLISFTCLSQPPLWWCWLPDFLFVCLCVCSGHSTVGKLAMILQWAITFVAVIYLWEIRSLSFVSLLPSCSYLDAHTHTHADALTPTEDAGRPSRPDTPKQWCFPLVSMAWGIIYQLIEFTLSPLCFPLTPSTSVASSFCSSVSSLISVSNPADFLSLFHSSLLLMDDTCRKPPASRARTWSQKCKYIGCKHGG